MEIPEGIISEIRVHPLPVFPLIFLPPAEQQGGSITGTQVLSPASTHFLFTETPGSGWR